MLISNQSPKKILFTIILFLFAISPLLISSTFLFLKDPPVWPDEAIFVDSALNLSATGVLSTNLFHGFLAGLEKHSLWYPPLYFYVLAGWIKVFGLGIESVRLLSFVLSIVALGLMFRISKIMFRSTVIAFLGTFLLASDIWFAKAARLARMDMLNFTFLLFTLLVFLTAEKENKPKKLYFLTGIFGGLSLLTHPLGLIAPAVISIYTVFKKNSLRSKLSKLIGISLPILTAACIWFFSIKDHLNLFWSQYHLQFLRKASATPYAITLFEIDPLWKIISVLYILIAALVVYRLVKFRQSSDLFIAIGIFISVMVLMLGKEMWYMLYFQPFIILGVLALIYNRKLFAVLFVLLLLLHNYFSLSTYLTQQGPNFDYHLYVHSLVGALPKTGTVFSSVIPDPYFDLKTTTALALLEFPTISISDENYKNLLDSADYIILRQIFDMRIIDYISRNTKKITIIGQDWGYFSRVIELVPKDQRR